MDTVTGTGLDRPARNAQLCGDVLGPARPTTWTRTTTSRSAGASARRAPTRTDRSATAPARSRTGTSAVPATSAAVPPPVRSGRGGGGRRRRCGPRGDPRSPGHRKGLSVPHDAVVLPRPVLLLHHRPGSSDLLRLPPAGVCPLRRGADVDRPRPDPTGKGRFERQALIVRDHVLAGRAFSCVAERQLRHLGKDCLVAFDRNLYAFPARSAPASGWRSGPPSRRSACSRPLRPPAATACWPSMQGLSAGVAASATRATGAHRWTVRHRSGTACFAGYATIGVCAFTAGVGARPRVE